MVYYAKLTVNGKEISEVQPNEKQVINNTAIAIFVVTNGKPKKSPYIVHVSSDRKNRYDIELVWVNRNLVVYRNAKTKSRYCDAITFWDMKTDRDIFSKNKK